jgi:hypothetical protein
MNRPQTIPPPPMMRRPDVAGAIHDIGGIFNKEDAAALSQLINSMFSGNEDFIRNTSVSLVGDNPTGPTAIPPRNGRSGGEVLTRNNPRSLIHELAHLLSYLQDSKAESAPFTYKERGGMSEEGNNLSYRDESFPETVTHFLQNFNLPDKEMESYRRRLFSGKGQDFIPGHEQEESDRLKKQPKTVAALTRIFGRTGNGELPGEVRAYLSAHPDIPVSDAMKTYASWRASGAGANK